MSNRLKDSFSFSSGDDPEFNSLKKEALTQFLN